uniref:Uncharacterized protein n=1 Tax=Anguilla anguilla TaxID=7936 RepID=A0A0E9PVF3_ANGAN
MLLFSLIICNYIMCMLCFESQKSILIARVQVFFEQQKLRF